MSRATFQESIRRSTILPAFSQSLAEVHFHPHADFASLQVFTCERLNSVLTKEACAANYTRPNAPLSCKGCPIGSAHAGVEVQRTATDVLNDPNSDRHARAAAANGLSCVRCLRSESTAKRFIGRFRLVQKAWCISCYNRTREVHSGRNSKLAKPVKWAGLRQTVITIEDATGTWTTLEPIMTTGRAEAERYVSRCHPGSVIVEVFVDGHAVKPGAPDPTPADWKADAVRKQNATVAARKRKPKLLPVASDREAFSEVDDYGNLRNAAKVEPVEFALDAESIATYWDLTADGLPDFIEWLCEGWTEPVAPFAPVEYLSEVTGNPWTGFAVTKRPIGDPSEASAAVADAIALPEVSEAVLSESEQPENESEWAGCYIVRDGVTTYVCDYAKERGISDEEAAIVLGMLDTDYSDEPEPAAAPESEPAPEPVKAAPAPTPKKLTGKQLRKLEKAQRRVERQQGDPQPAPNRMPAKQTAIAARAYALLQAGK